MVNGETGGNGVAGNVLKWISKGLKKLTRFKAKAGPCTTDLAAIGLTQATVRSLASSVQVLSAAWANPGVYAALEAQGADFGVVTGDAQNTIYYDQNFFWQTSFKLVMATLIHEFSHVNGFGDFRDQVSLGLTPGPFTVNITNILWADCFGVKGL